MDAIHWSSGIGASSSGISASVQIPVQNNLNQNTPTNQESQPQHMVDPAGSGISPKKGKVVNTNDEPNHEGSSSVPNDETMISGPIKITSAPTGPQPHDGGTGTKVNPNSQGAIPQQSRADVTHPSHFKSGQHDKLGPTSGSSSLKKTKMKARSHQRVEGSSEPRRSPNASSNAPGDMGGRTFRERDRSLSPRKHRSS